MEYKHILCEQVGNVLKVTLNRPEKRNAQDGILISELHDAMVRADSDDSIRVVVLLGAGKSFSAGHDLKEGSASGPFSDYDREATYGRLKYADDILFGYWMFIHDLRKPTIAGVQGYLATAGISLAAMCDIIVAADDAKFLDHAVTLFATPGTELAWYPWELGVRKAKEFLWTQPVWDAETMERLGLVNRVVPRTELEESVMAMAEQIALASPLAVQMTKRTINKAWDLMGKRAAFDYHLVTQQMAMMSDESSRKAEQRGDKATTEWLSEVRHNANVTDPRTAHQQTRA